jgi:hypothetical protein
MSRRQVRRVARAELRRRVRAVTDDARQLIAMVLTGCFVALGVLGGTAAAYFAGGAVASGDIDAPAVAAEPFGAAVLVAVGFLTVIREMNRGAPPALAGHLTTVTAPTLATGYLLVEYAITGAILLPLAVLGAAAFALGAGAPAAGATVLLAALAAWVFAVPVWQCVLFGVKYAFARVPALATHRTAIAIVAFGAYMAVAVSGEAGAVLSPVFSVLAATPVGWFSHLGLLTLGGAPFRAAGAFALAAVGTPLAVVGARRGADALWHADPLPAEQGGSETHSSGAGVERHLPVSRPTAAVVRRCWRRGLRAPITLVYVPYPLFFLIAPIGESLSTGRVSASLAVLLALYAPWAVGAAFTLNPLGDEGAVLPGTLTSGVGGGRYVLGRVLAGALPGTPLAVLGVLALGVVSPLSLPGTLALAAVVALLCPAAAALAAGFGAALPNTESSTVFRSREAVMPSPWAFLGYSVVLLFAAAPAVAVWHPFSAGLLGAGPGVGPLRSGGTLLSALLGVGAGAVGFRVAAGAVSGFVLD